MQRILRTTVSLPFAGLITLSLAFLMAALIKVETGPLMQPQDRVFDLFPAVEVVAPPDRWLPETIDSGTPPEPIRLDVSRQTPDDVEMEALSVSLPRIDAPVIDRLDPVMIDRPETPIFRRAPVYPPRAIQRELEGSCQVFFDLNTSGHPFNVRAVDCTSLLFARAAETAVRGWRYEPRIIDGQAVERRDRSVLIEFTLD